MEYNRLLELVDKLENNTATKSELEELDVFYQSFENSDGITSKLNDEQAYKAELFKKVRVAVGFGPEHKKSGVTKLWPRLLIVAASISLIAIGVYFFRDRSGIGINQNVAIANDIAPGKNGATLTLSDGKKIKLSDVATGELAKEAGVVITKTTDGKLVYEIKNASTANKINTISTAKGETYQLRLPDGSLVWLNAASSLTYAANLIESGKRSVKLEGEGYFEISKDKLHPFIVESKGQKLEVLGTHFNINAYSDELSVQTTLLEGSVKINNKTILKPNEQAINTGPAIKVIQVDGTVYTDWKDGIFTFRKEHLRTILAKISKWYDVDIQLQGRTDDQITFSGTISRNTPISGVLKLLEAKANMRFKVDGKKLVVIQ